MKALDFKSVISVALALVMLIVAIPVSAQSNISPDMPELKITDYNSDERILPYNDNTVMPYLRFPESYSAVDAGVITAPKNQGQHGTCWTFAAASMAETSILSSGGTFGGGKIPTVDNIDLSEAQLAYFTYKNAYDPLGNLDGDGTEFMAGDWLEAGGNQYFSTFAFASWQGLCEENVMPYSELTSESEYDIQLSYEASARLENSLWLHMDDVESVKSLIMEYGSVLSDYAHHDVFCNDKTGAYYCPDAYYTNHAITIIGWDDNYSRKNFNEDPGRDGAWLIKNSWGEEWGDEGFGWISYEDESLRHSEAFCMLFGDSEKYDNNYQYDGSCMVSSISLNSGMLVANTYKASASEKERIDAVSFALLSSNVEYSVQIYNKCKNYKLMNGEALLSEPVEGCTSYPGYYTIEIPEDVVVSRGDEYTVCIEFRSSDGGSVDVLIDHSATDEIGNFEFTNNLENDRSYYGQYFDLSSTGMYFSDLVSSYECTARIKAFTSNVEEEAPETTVPETTETETTEPETTEPENPADPEDGKGDLSGDGSINMLDVFKLKLIIAQKVTPTDEEIAAADVNGDGYVNALDSFNIKFRIMKGYWIN